MGRGVMYSETTPLTFGKPLIVTGVVHRYVPAGRTVGAREIPDPSCPLLGQAMGVGVVGAVGVGR